MRRLMEILHSGKPQLLELENVVGVGLGYKEVGGTNCDQMAVKVLVKRKIPSSDIPKTQIVPRTIQNVATDVIEVGELTLLNRTNKVRPASPGVSIGHPKVTAGTFGAVVRDRKTGRPLILSNNHVLANITDGTDGRAKVGDPILQPGRYDGGQMEDVIGHLERFVPIRRVTSRPVCPIALGVEFLGNAVLKAIQPAYEIRFVRMNNAENLVDAAVARPVSDDAVMASVLEVGEVRGVREVEIGMRVKKSGRTTGITTGVVRVIKATLKVSLGDVGEAYFADQIVTTAMAEPGDSGSLVVTEDGDAVGLLGAGSDQATICSRIQNVLEMLDVTF